MSVGPVAFDHHIGVAPGVLGSSGEDQARPLHVVRLDQQCLVTELLCDREQLIAEVRRGIDIASHHLHEPTPPRRLELLAGGADLGGQSGGALVDVEDTVIGGADCLYQRRTPGQVDGQLLMATFVPGELREEVLRAIQVSQGVGMSSAAGGDGGRAAPVRDRPGGITGLGPVVCESYGVHRPIRRLPLLECETDLPVQGTPAVGRQPHVRSLLDERVGEGVRRRPPRAGRRQDL